jgi:hypothetical protein
MLLEIPINSDRIKGLFFDVPCAMTNSIEVVFIPSRRGVMTPRSAAERSA